MIDLHMPDGSHGHPQGAPPWHHTTPVPTTPDVWENVTRAW